MAIERIKTKNLLWLHISQPSPKDLDQLKEEYGFHPLDLEDCLVKIQRPQISEYPHYIFFILTWPFYDRKTRTIESSEMDFFVGPKYLVTISDGLVPTVNNFFREMKRNDYSQEQYMQANHPALLLYEILHRLQNYTMPMLDHVNQDIENIEHEIFSGKEKIIAKEILNIKRNIVNLRKIMQAHKNIIKKLIGTNQKSFMPDNADVYFANILDRTKDIWDILETQKENIVAFHEANESLISFKLNEIMRILTIISVILLPANLIAVTFGMETHYTPIIGSNYDFYIIFSIMIILMLSLVGYFKKKDWL
ncbi:MAG: magnesium transporter CorA family protein [Patescibacteria group bacterium]